MDSQRVISSLQLIGKVYDSILDNSYQYVIPQAISTVQVTKNAYEYARRNQTRGYTPVPWGYCIQHEYPLKFLPVVVPNSVELQVDVYCDVRWADQDIPIVQDIKIRVWSTHTDTIFDEKRDSQTVLDELTREGRNINGRVVSRLHFDKANLNPNTGIGYHPEYHVQYGGISEDYELCWHPKKVNLPRLNHQPLELFLVCQIIAANFFPDIYRDQIREKAEWRQELVHYQNLLLRGYYEKCLGAINNNDSLLDVLSI
jgi:hypothetical protein